VPSVEALRWLGAGGVLAGGSLLLDDEVLHTFADGDQDPPVAVGENLGEAGLHFGVPFAVYVVARATSHPAAADMAIVVLRTQTVNGILTRGLKLLPRPRPYQEAATATKGSFPSGHASTAFATATVLQRRWGWRVGVPAYTVASFVAATRLQNVHYLSDVAFGVALGVASGLAVRLPGPQPAVAPMIAPGVAGVSVTIGGSRPSRAPGYSAY
jgi:membrane-associated phospholipid phosphatase